MIQVDKFSSLNELRYVLVVYISSKNNEPIINMRRLRFIHLRN